MRRQEGHERPRPSAAAWSPGPAGHPPARPRWQVRGFADGARGRPCGSADGSPPGAEHVTNDGLATGSLVSGDGNAGPDRWPELAAPAVG
jgi:hypothetical protein